MFWDVILPTLAAVYTIGYAATFFGVFGPLLAFGFEGVLRAARSSIPWPLLVLERYLNRRWP